MKASPPFPLWAAAWLAFAAPAAGAGSDLLGGITAEQRRDLEARFPGAYEQAGRKLGEVLASLEGARDEKGRPLSEEAKRRRAARAAEGVLKTLLVGSKFARVEKSHQPRRQKARELADLKEEMRRAEDLLGPDHVPFMLEDGGLGKIMTSVEKGVHHWKRTMDHNPWNPDAFLGGGREYLRSDQPAEAAEAFSRALELSPASAEAYAGRAAARLRLGDARGAYEDALAALRLDPRHAAAYSVKKLAEGRGGRRRPAPAAASPASPAAASVESASSFAPLPAGAAQSARWAREAESAYRVKDFSRAQSLAEKALSAYPKNPQAYYVKASLDMRNRDYAAAAQNAASGLELAPDSKPLLKARAAAALRLKDAAAAMEAANRLLELEPEGADVLAYRAGALGLEGDREAMLENLRLAAAKDPRYQESLASALAMPQDSDLLFLFPGEQAPAPRVSSAGGGRSRFALVLAASLAGGLLIGFGLIPSLAARRGGRPTLSGQYRVKRRIGLGGMGEVFEGEDLALERPVAVKKMREELRRDRAQRERFVAEAKTVAALHHPHIVDIYAIAEEGDDVYLVFEYVSGKTVHEMIQEKGRLSYGEALGVLKGAAAALDFAHGRGVVHRDLKPSNIMVNEQGHVKVMDFGIARLAKDAAAGLPMTNTIVGTPAYMAPEQEQGAVRPESDVYALAVCFYEMLCGRVPFSGLGGGLLMSKVDRAYVPASKLAPGLPEGADEIFARALQPDAGKRFASAGEMLTAFGALARGGRVDLASQKSYES